MNAPRQQFYNFAHRALKDDAHTEHKLWSFITGDKADSYAQMRWHDAGEAAGESHLPEKLLWFAPINEDGIEIRLLHMPSPQNATEAYYAAFVRNPQQQFPLRYFVAERNTDGGATWAEWRPDMRVRGMPLAEWPTDMQKRVALPMPYAATFVEAILSEVRAFPNVTDLPKLSLPKPGAASNAGPAKTSGGANTRAIIIIIVAIVLLAILGVVLR